MLLWTKVEKEVVVLGQVGLLLLLHHHLRYHID